MSEPKYGTMKKKVVFYDSDKRFADFKLKLQRDGLSQAQFFRGIVTGYIDNDESLLDFIDKLKKNKKIGNQTKSSVNQNRRLIKSGKQLISDLNLEDTEKMSIFDLIESENPDF
jgi:hypothetical protein|tara:strand:+ start:360 stop:701 length:342 start_codon:yes stop_codon:yes gene_type:complete